MSYSTREAWLDAAAVRLWALLPTREQEVDLASGAGPTVKVSVGWPKGRHGRRAVGECWAIAASADQQTSHIFISPELVERGVVLAVLAHELCHVWAGTEAKHRGAFIRAMKHIGMTRPWTSSVPTAGFMEHLEELAEELGVYPHVRLDRMLKPKQKTRMRLYECSHGQKVRAATDSLKAECQECGTPFVRQGGRGGGEGEDEGEGEEGGEDDAADR